MIERDRFDNRIFYLLQYVGKIDLSFDEFCEIESILEYLQSQYNLLFEEYLKLRSLHVSSDL